MHGQMEIFGTSDIGRKRNTNEDHFMISDLCKSMRVHSTSLALDHRTRLFGETQGRLLLVADGMGGHDSGERASQLALDGIVDYVLNSLSWYLLHDDIHEDEEFQKHLKAGLLNCQQMIERDIALAPQRQGMGSTLTMAYIAWPRMFVVHVGDSRCYLLRDGEIKQLTRDHTMAEAVLGHRESKESEPDREGPLTNMLWNVLGGKDEPHPDAASYHLQIGDALVLCTDGLTKHLCRKRIAELIGSDRSLENACNQAIQEANDAGGSDNLTIVACRFRKSRPIQESEEAIDVLIPEADDIDDKAVPVSETELVSQTELVSETDPVR
ncbi:PP2C family protein-serine/threonine phosphatase [Novipirellula rosea]|uniref:Protein phosphatase 2C domain-containing protein n=1 Tax=Novipirellula rosea TaxID=1031540 RepID=A0ABP8N3A9_9BACT